MSEKVSTSVYLDASHVEWMKAESINRSDLINNLLGEYRENNGSLSSVMREHEIRQLRSEIEAEKAKMNAKQSHLEALMEENERESIERKAELAEAHEALADTPREPDNPAIMNWARDLGMTPEDLIDELEAGDE